MRRADYHAAKPPDPQLHCKVQQWITKCCIIRCKTVEVHAAMPPDPQLHYEVQVMRGKKIHQNCHGSSTRDWMG
eukprot:1162143-Pelagomonas_calceolata.AAC.29